MPLPGLCGRVCPHPCEAVCRRGEVDEPINIMNLKQSAWNYEYFRNQVPNIPEKKAPTGKTCAVIGAGPAGLSAAYYLALMGHQVEVFDKMQEPGGMTAAGIPDFIAQSMAVFPPPTIITLLFSKGFSYFETLSK